MEELREKANRYAEENVNNVLKETFAKVYAEGYRTGYKDRENEIPVDLRDDKREFVDLGLPSGTLWATDYELDEDKVCYLPYIEAKEFDIPTKEQFRELLKECLWKFIYIHRTSRKYICVGPNGNHIVFYSRGYELAGKTQESAKIYFWVKSDTETSSKEAAYLDYNSGEIKKITEMFSGSMLPLRLVKNIR